MTLEEAIEIKSFYDITAIGKVNARWLEADKISIEAMKRVKDNPYIAHHYLRALLPGETKD